MESLCISGQEWRSICLVYALTQLPAKLANIQEPTGCTAVFQSLLFLAFWHHMPQICASAVFDAFFLRKIELFSRLKTHWEFIDWFSFDPLGIDVFWRWLFVFKWESVTGISLCSSHIFSTTTYWRYSASRWLPWVCNTCSLTARRWAYWGRRLHPQCLPSYPKNC